MRNIVGKTLRQLRGTLGHLPPRRSDSGHARWPTTRTRCWRSSSRLLNRRLSGLRIRIHGDYHLEQVLYTGKDFVIIDFDGVRRRDAGRAAPQALGACATWPG